MTARHKRKFPMSLPVSVCVYCGASENIKQTYKDAARALGTVLGSNGIRTVYGGGKVGLMGIVADAALAAGGEVIGVIPQHIQGREIAHLALTELHVVDSMHVRKRMMVDRAEAFIVLPGGYGTLDEAFEIITWKQLGLHDRSVIFVNVAGYFDPLLAFVAHALEEGFLSSRHLSLFKVVDRVEEVLPALKRLPEPVRTPETGRM
jgi:uncharacterized protein (TIGR00730 family)